MKNTRGLTLVEILTTIGILAILATIVMAAVIPVRKKGRDAKRKFELAQIGRFMAGSSCYEPDGGPGEYDLADLFSEIIIKNPQVKAMIGKVPRDPNGGTDSESFYIYLLSDDGKKCSIYANLENENEKVTLSGITEPTAGRGTGVLEGITIGHNGSNKYFQVSN